MYTTLCIFFIHVVLVQQTLSALGVIEALVCVVSASAEEMLR